MAGGDAKSGPAAETKIETKDEEKKEKKGGQQEFKFAAKGDEKSGWEGFMLFLWNPETSEFLGRTGMSWLKIGVFYLIYYACLAGFFMLMLLAFFQTLSDTEPAYDTETGIIGKNPGVGFRPMPNADKNIESTLIWFRHGSGEGHNGNWGPWVSRLEDHLTNYKNENYARDQEAESDPIDCYSAENITEPGAEQICKVNQQLLFQGSCKNESGYGFPEGKPCILIKLNKIFNWVPEPYESIKEMEEDDVPQSIRDEFQQNIKEGAPEKNEKVWLECEGENPADKENIGPIKYYPERGVGKHYFPYRNQKGYLSPVVFAQLQQPQRGVMIAINCKAWAANIKHDAMERAGLVHFELMID